MPSKELKNRIDAQWRALQPNWDRKQYNNELKMLYDNLINNENIQVLIGCTWGPADSFDDDASRMAKFSRFDGIAVATDSRVLFLKKRGFSKMVSSMPLHGIEIEEQAGVGEVIVTGPCISNWFGGGSSLTGGNTTYVMRGLQGNEVGQFTGYLRGGRGGDVSPVVSEPPVAFTSEPATTEHPDKSSRIDTQWRDRLLFPGRNKFDGEREMLHTILDEDENIEVLLGGRWDKKGRIGRISYGPTGGNPEKGNDGVVVATDRRVLFLDKSFGSEKVVEMPYDDIEGVSSNIGVISDGLIIASRAIDDHEFHFDHENSLNYKGLTGVFADRVRGLKEALDPQPSSQPPDADV